MIEKDFKYFRKNQKDLVKKYNGKYIIIKDGKVVSSYSTKNEALENALKEYKAGTFLMQLCSLGDEVFTHEYYTGVVF